MLLPIPYDIRLFPFQNLNNDSGKSSDKKRIKLIIKTIKCMSILSCLFLNNNNKKLCFMMNNPEKKKESKTFYTPPCT